jgi:ABC-type protease/lipase transport system fused ATPase/permease subunit
MVGDKKKDHDAERAAITPPPPGLASPPARGAGRTPAPDLVVSSVALASTGVFLSGVSLTVRGGERVGITGLRGSGATTLARIVAGAAAPDAGEVRLC